MASTDTPTPTGLQPAARRESLFHRLYVGTGALDIIGKRRRWYVVFAALLLLCIGSIAIRGFNYGIEFTGGTRIQMTAASATGTITKDQVTQVYQDTLGRPANSVLTVGSGGSQTIQIRSVPLDNPQVAKLKSALTTKLHPVGVDGKPSAVSDSAVSPSWGGEISSQALIALFVFLVLVTIFLTLYFERWMAVAALASVINVVLVTAGVYSLVHFEVNPATVIGLLTILGFSLYDTVVVFDKVRENTRGLLGLTRRTYPEAANLAVNQTLMRSINTSLIALLPVLGLLVVGFGLLGVGTLQDLALVQLTGILAGTVSSLFLATPLLVDLKMRLPEYRAQADRVVHRRANLARKAAAQAESEPDVNDDEALDAELRREKAYAAAASVPSRTGKSRSSARGSRPSGKKRR